MIKNVKAHCDIPCKVYDPYIAQYAALSVIRLQDLIAEKIYKPIFTDEICYAH